MSQERSRNPDGKYAKETACDACGKPVGAEHYTDEEICGSGDGPGFYLCGRARCAARLEELGPAERRALYRRKEEP